MTDADVHRRRPVWAAVLAGLLHLAVLPFYVTSGLAVPGWALLGLLALWAAGASAVVAWRRRGPVLLLVPVAAVVLWVAVLTAGDLLLGWTA